MTPTTHVHPSEHRGTLATIKTRDNRGLSLERHPNGTVKLFAGKGAAQTFWLVMIEVDQFALRLPDSLEYISVQGASGFTLASGDFGPHETFQLTPSAGSDYFGLLNVATKRHLSAPTGPAAGLKTKARGAGTEAELFTFDVIRPEGAKDEPPHHAGCCGPWSKPDAPAGAADALLWDEYSHFRIVEIAVHYLRNMENPTEEAKFVSDMWHKGSKKIAEGLKGADEWDAWMPGHPVWVKYYYHFYNPQQKRSFPPDTRTYPYHAVSLGSATFEEALRLYRLGPGSHQDAFVHLGLSLHYLTDLCQPMHAANFINMPLLDDWRHWYFETYAEEYVAKRDFFQQQSGKYPPIRRDEVADTSPTAAAWLIGVATQSYATWDEVLRHEVDKKEKWIPGPNGRRPVYDNTWRPGEADPSLKRSLWFAPRNTARYLCMWAARARA